MFAVIESLTGTVSQVVTFKTRESAEKTFKKFAKVNSADIDLDTVLGNPISLAKDDNGYEVVLIETKKGD